MERYNLLLKNIVNLKIYQNRWKSKTRVDRGMNYYLKKGKLTKKQEKWYRKHQNVWYIWFSGEYATTIGKNLYEKSIKVSSKAFNFLLDLNLRQGFRAVGTTFKFIFSHEYKVEIGRNYVRKGRNDWKEKGRLNEEQVSLLEEQIKSNVFADYFADLGVHAVIWPTGKVLDAIAGSYLLMTGHPYLAAVVVGYGTTPFLRFFYTAGRFVQSSINGKEKPWWAFIGIVPTLGNIAYPIQMARSAAKGNEELPMFLIVQKSTKIGEKFPIIGGQDTLTEHKFNHLGYRIGRYFGRKNRL